jgi:murein DD-endopeptidase MepM/ murein hydrolase activator NlpD
MFVVSPRLVPAVLLSLVIAVTPSMSPPPVKAGAVAAVSSVALQPDPPSVAVDGPWKPPVDAPIVDYFRAPTHRYGPGNRGLEYGTSQGQPVGAVAAGVVVFAGQVGGRLYVVVSHGPDLRSTYAYLHSIAVSEGERVIPGQRLAAATTGFHLTARYHGRYIDPLPLFGWRYRVRLVAPETRPTSAPHRVAEGGIPPRRAL